MKYNFYANSTSLILDLDTQSGLYNKESFSYINPSVTLGNNILTIKDFGNTQHIFLFENIGAINGANPTDISDAFNKILAIIPSSSGGGGGTPATEYNTPTNYDTVANLPITFPSNTIHQISILSKLGNTTFTVNGEVSILEEGQSTVIPADGLIDVVITINSCDGEFIATTIS